MQNANAIKLTWVPPGRSIRQPKAVAILGLLVMLGLLAVLFGADPRSAVAPQPDMREAVKSIEAMNVDDREQILAEGLDAKSRNASIKRSSLPLQSARALVLNDTSTSTYVNALRCLTQAIYYEAANEPIEGRRAVAQVILNRMRHPAYPKSVCGVVYQGHERYTGCQFSFTCDGSLMRTPLRSRWLEATQVARHALAGHVERSVGTATHYHADYVLPKWAFQLGKIGQIGRHIFYRFSGTWGNTAAFSGHYNGNELIPQIDFSALKARLNSKASEEAVTAVPGLTVAPHISDRHSERDIGGRLDVTKDWRLAIPDPVAANSRLRAIVESEPDKQAPVRGEIAMANVVTATVAP